MAPLITQMPQADHLQSPLLQGAGFSHAFFTRKGGVSAGPYRSLNFSVSVGDDPDRVKQNLGIAADRLGVTVERVLFLSQVHGTTCHLVNGDETFAEVSVREGDALLSRSPTVACGVRTADCMPILIADDDTGAVAAVHAGWRGVERGVIRKAVERLRRVIGREGRLLAAIGPHISARAFEVSADVADRLAKCSTASDALQLSYGAKPHVNLRLIARAQLSELGISAEQIDDVAGCTFGDTELFFSYRRDGKVGGRHLSAIVARG